MYSLAPAQKSLSTIIDKSISPDHTLLKVFSYLPESRRIEIMEYFKGNYTGRQQILQDSLNRDLELRVFDEYENLEYYTLFKHLENGKFISKKYSPKDSLIGHSEQQYISNRIVFCRTYLKDSLIESETAKLNKHGDLVYIKGESEYSNYENSISYEYENDLVISRKSIYKNLKDSIITNESVRVEYIK